MDALAVKGRGFLKGEYSQQEFHQSSLVGLHAKRAIAKRYVCADRSIANSQADTLALESDLNLAAPICSAAGTQPQFQFGGYLAQQGREMDYLNHVRCASALTLNQREGDVCPGQYGQNGCIKGKARADKIGAAFRSNMKDLCHQSHKRIRARGIECDTANRPGIIPCIQITFDDAIGFVDYPQRVRRRGTAG